MTHDLAEPERAELRYVTDITEDDVDAVLACLALHVPSEEAGTWAFNLATTAYVVGRSLATRIRERLRLVAAGGGDHGTMVLVRDEWNDLMCCVEPWEGRALFDERRFRTVEHMNEAGAAFRAYALSQARKFGRGPGG
jgi:hypothetical protein